MYIFLKPTEVGDKEDMDYPILTTSARTTHNDHAEDDGTEVRYIFYCRALTGEPKVMGGRKAPPEKPGKKWVTYDSTTDRKQSEFVFVDQDQLYPEYLIKYSYKNTWWKKFLIIKLG